MLKKIPQCSKSPAPWCLMTLRMLPVCSVFAFPFALLCLLFPMWRSVFLLLRNAFSGFPLDWGQVATSSSLPSLQTGLPVRPHAYVRSYRFCPNAVLLPFLRCTSLTHIKQCWNCCLVELKSGCLQRKRILQHTLKEKDFINQSV